MTKALTDVLSDMIIESIEEIDVVALLDVVARRSNWQTAPVRARAATAPSEPRRGWCRGWWWWRGALRRWRVHPSAAHARRRREAPPLARRARALHLRGAERGAPPSAGDGHSHEERRADEDDVLVAVARDHGYKEERDARAIDAELVRGTDLRDLAATRGAAGAGGCIQSRRRSEPHEVPA